MDAKYIIHTLLRSHRIGLRVLIIGRANAGKTTILQSVCHTTESPTIYRDRDFVLEEVRHGGPKVLTILSNATQITLDPSMEVGDRSSCLLSPINALTPSQRGEHDIDDQIVFPHHRGYVFHDSRGIESGGTEELQTLKKFIQEKASANQLHLRLHAIWFGLSCVNDVD